MVLQTLFCSYYSPFHIACENKKSFNIAKYLLDRGIDINIKTKDGKTAFFLACENNNTQTINFLIENGADINDTNDKNDFNI